MGHKVRCMVAVQSRNTHPVLAFAFRKGLLKPLHIVKSCKADLYVQLQIVRGELSGGKDFE